MRLLSNTNRLKFVDVLTNNDNYNLENIVG